MRRKHQPTRREPAADQDGADGPDKSADNDIARMMGEHDNAAEHDEKRKNPHDRPHLRRQRPDRDGGRRDIRGMAGRHTGIFRPPDERPIGERIVVAADIGARAADQALDDGVEQAWRADREEQKAEARGERREHALRYARQRRRRHRGKAEKDEGGRDQEPAAKSEIGDLFKSVETTVADGVPNRLPRCRRRTSRLRRRRA